MGGILLKVLVNNNNGSVENGKRRISYEKAKHVAMSLEK